jgi:hypothetical protein
MDQDPLSMPFQLDAGETFHIAAGTEPEMLALTSHREIITSDHRASLDVPVASIRRIQLDVEVGRPATLVIVPHEPEHPPQVLSVPHEELEATTRAVYLLGDRLREQG